jgi:hypothetical protein
MGKSLTDVRLGLLTAQFLLWLLIAALSIAILFAAPGASVLTFPKSQLPSPPVSIVSLCYDKLRKLNQPQTSNPTLDEIVEEAILNLNLVPGRPLVETCLEWAGMPARAKSVPLPAEAPPRWIQEDRQREQAYTFDLWKWRGVWIALPLFAAVAAGSLALLGLRRICLNLRA